MELVRFNPRRDVFGLHNHFNRMVEEFFSPTLKREEGLSVETWNPAVDIYDEKGSIVIKAELPGVDKKDIEIDVKDGLLTLRGERKTDNEVKEDKYYRRESFCGKFERSFTLPADVDVDKIKAQYKKGILTLEIPKPEEHKPRQITVH